MTNTNNDMPKEIWVIANNIHDLTGVHHAVEQKTRGYIKYTRTDTITKQEAVDVNIKVDNAIESLKEIDDNIDLDYFWTEEFEIIKNTLMSLKNTNDKDRVMDMMAAALKTCEWIRDENGHDWFHYDEEKVSQALKEYDRLKASDETVEIEG